MVELIRCDTDQTAACAKHFFCTAYPEPSHTCKRIDRVRTKRLSDRTKRSVYDGQECGGIDVKQK